MLRNLCQLGLVIETTGSNVLTHWYHMALRILVNIGTGNGLLPDSTKSLPEPIWTYCQWDPSGHMISEILKLSFKKIHLKMLSAKCLPFCSGLHVLTHWGWVTHICVGNLTIFGSDNGMSPGRRQAIIWTNAGILLIQRLGTNLKIIHLHWRKCILKCRLENGGHFVSSSMC